MKTKMLILATLLLTVSCQKEQIEDLLVNKTYFTDGEGLGLKTLSVKLIEVKEEKDIYGL